MITSRLRLAPIALAAVVFFGAAACSATTDVVPTEAAQASEPAAQVVAESQAEPTPVVEAEMVDAADTAPVTAEVSDTNDAAASTGDGTVEITFDDGRSWSLAVGDCYTEPDSAFGVFFMSGTSPDGADLGIVESWPLDGDRSGGTAFIGTFYDEAGDIYVVEGGTVSDTGDMLSFTSPIYEGFSAEPTLTGSFSCTR